VAESDGRITVTDALEMVSSNIEKLLGIKPRFINQDLVVVSGGGPFSFESKAIGMISPRRGVVDFF
jgi:hypothetical protein